MNWQLFFSASAFVLVNLGAIVGAYYGLKADNAALGARLELSLANERASRTAEHVSLKESVMGTVATVESSMRELTRRVGSLETGQDEWTKTLRQRTHDLATQVNALMLKVDRLERPTGERP